jgi:hypothetical protein
MLACLPATSALARLPWLGCPRFFFLSMCVGSGSGPAQAPPPEGISDVVMMRVIGESLPVIVLEVARDHLVELLLGRDVVWMSWMVADLVVAAGVVGPDGGEPSARVHKVAVLGANGGVVDRWLDMWLVSSLTFKSPSLRKTYSNMEMVQSNYNFYNFVRNEQFGD